MNDTHENCIYPRERRHSKAIRVTLLVAVVLIAGAATTAAFSMGHHGGYGGPLSRMTERLDLSDEQRERIEAILAAGRDEAEPLREDLQAMREDLRELVKTDVFYEDQVRAKVGAHSETMIELAVVGARTVHAVRSELTPEQRAEAEAMLDRFAEFGPRERFRRR